MGCRHNCGCGAQPVEIDLTPLVGQGGGVLRAQPEESWRDPFTYKTVSTGPPFLPIPLILPCLVFVALTIVLLLGI